MIDIDFSLGATVDLEARFRDWTSTDAVQRLWDKDTTLWREDPTTPELADRLGWTRHALAAHDGRALHTSWR